MEHIYTTDEAYQQNQKQQARADITGIAQRYLAREKRLAELDWRRRVYQALGEHQNAIDVQEEQMVAWGRKEGELFLLFSLCFAVNKARP